MSPSGFLNPSNTLIGQSQEEAQVSRTSSSCFKWPISDFGFWISNLEIASSFVFATTQLPFSSYHAGIRCPHHNWRDRHQSRTFSIQYLYVLMNLFGISFTS